MVLQFFVGEIYNFDPSNCENIIRRIQFPFRNEIKSIPRTKIHRDNRTISKRNRGKQATLEKHGLDRGG